VKPALHVSPGFFARVRQAGNAPGFSFTVEQSFHAVWAQACFRADVAECRRHGAEASEVFAQRVYDGPVLRGQFRYSVMQCKFDCDMLVPLTGVKEKTFRAYEGFNVTVGYVCCQHGTNLVTVGHSACMLVAGRLKIFSGILMKKFLVHARQA
jgi:hypothetical protein